MHVLLNLHLSSGYIYPEHGILFAVSLVGGEHITRSLLTVATVL